MDILTKANPIIGKQKNALVYKQNKKTQIGGIRYCHNKRMFFGLENVPISKKAAQVPLTDSWVKETFDERITKRIKLYANEAIETLIIL